MISGRVIYRTGNNTYTYTVDAFDTSETFSMYITSGNYLAIRNMSGLPDDSDQDCLNWCHHVSRGEEGTRAD